MQAQRPGSLAGPLEVDSTALLEQVLASPSPVLSEMVFQGLDLRPYAARLLEKRLPGCIFLGCWLDDHLAGHIAREGCLSMPRIKDKPYDPYRTHLYTVSELYAEFDPRAENLLESYRQTLDFRVYASYRDPMDPHGRLRDVLVDEALVRRIHDNSVTDALDEWLAVVDHHGLVGVMGGHARSRLDPVYAQIARLARQLRRSGYLPASGGGPGFMEATNLGAYLAPYPDEALERALAELALCPTFQHGVGMWLATAFRVRALFPPLAGGESLGVPTWFYGHEPPNVFASHIAKYFENSLREEGLLALATGGMIFAPGGAGTLQEVFQDACQNYYTTYHVRSPMIFFPRAFWLGESPDGFPAYPALERLAEQGKFSHLVHLVDEPHEIPQFLEPLPKAGGLPHTASS